MVEPNVDPPDEKEKLESDSEKQARIARLIEQLTQPSKEINNTWFNGQAKLLGLPTNCENEAEIRVIANGKMEAIDPHAIQSALKAAGASDTQVQAAFDEAVKARSHLDRAAVSWISNLRSIRATENAAGRRGPGDPVVSSSEGRLPSVDRAWEIKNKLAHANKKRSPSPIETDEESPLVVPPRDVSQQTSSDEALASSDYLQSLKGKGALEIINLGNKNPPVSILSTNAQILDAGKSAVQFVHSKYPSIIGDFLKIISSAVSTFSQLREVLKGSSSEKGSDNKKSLGDQFASFIDTFKKSTVISSSYDFDKKQESPKADTPKQTPGGSAAT